MLGNENSKDTRASNTIPILIKYIVVILVIGCAIGGILKIFSGL